MNNLTILLQIILVVIYFIPTIITLKRNLKSLNIILLNIFFGWTLIYWVVSLTLSIILEKDDKMTLKEMLSILFGLDNPM
jgi:hypothetical protein